MVEGNQIDWEAHDNDFADAQREVLTFDITVNLAVQFAMKNPGTLVVVIADHETGGLTINGGEEKDIDIDWASKNLLGTPVGKFRLLQYQ